MKYLKPFVAATLIASFAISPFTMFAGEQPAKQKAKPYTLKTCIVSGEKLGEMGDPYTFTYKEREIKLCCKSCQKDFNKQPAKYIKKLDEAEAKAKKATAKPI